VSLIANIRTSASEQIPVAACMLASARRRDKLPPGAGIASNSLATFPDRTIEILMLATNLDQKYLTILSYADLPEPRRVIQQMLCGSCIGADFTNGIV